MACSRCGGMMIIDGLLDESGFRIDQQAERCLNCGHWEDTVIWPIARPRVQSGQVRLIGSDRRELTHDPCYVSAIMER